MTMNFFPLRRQRFGAIVLVALLVAALASCAQAPASTPGNSGAIAPASAPGPIDYRGFPYNIKAGG